MIMLCLETPDSQETKQHKATVIASRLLKELAGEQIASHHTEESTNKDQNKDAIKPVNHPGTEKVESHIETPNDDDEEIEFTPTIEDLYEIYANQYPQQLLDNEESSSESAEEDYILPISKQQLMRYLAEQQESMLLYFYFNYSFNLNIIR